MHVISHMRDSHPLLQFSYSTTDLRTENAAKLLLQEVTLHPHTHGMRLEDTIVHLRTHLESLEAKQRNRRPKKNRKGRRENCSFFGKLDFLTSLSKPDMYLLIEYKWHLKGVPECAVLPLSVR